MGIAAHGGNHLIGERFQCGDIDLMAKTHVTHDALDHLGGFIKDGARPSALCHRTCVQAARLVGYGRGLLEIWLRGNGGEVYALVGIYVCGRCPR